MENAIEPLDAQPALVLVNPQLGQNIGAAARAMLNFGLERLRIVAPRDGWPNPDAIAMASGAGRILDNAELFPSLSAALANVHHAYATTARRRDLSKRIAEPREAMAEARVRIERNERVAIIFGPERAGLSNDDLVLANSLISVPANPTFNSLNLAQCVLLIGYEWFRSSSNEEVAGLHPGLDALATIRAKESFVEQLERDLESTRYFWPKEMGPGMRMNLRNLFMRLELTEAEVRTLHGVRTALKRSKADNRSGKTARSTETNSIGIRNEG